MIKYIIIFISSFIGISLIAQDKISEVCNAPIDFDGITKEELYRQAEIIKIDSTVRANKKFVDIFNPRAYSQGAPSGIDSLPYGISKIIGNTMYLVCVDKIKWDMTGGYVNAVAAIDFPMSCSRIAFQGSNIKINAEGLAKQTAAKLMLASKMVIPLGKNIKLILPNDESNYLEFDCNGYKGVSLKGYFVFDTSILEPDLLMQGSENQVRASFEFKGADLKNIFVSTSITPFTIKGIDGLSFSVTKATWDGSDFENPSSQILNEVNPYSGSETKLWKGFHLENIDIALPKGFATKDNKRITINAHDLVIYKNGGVSGYIGAENNIATSDNTAISGWPISINKFHFKLLQSKLAGGSLEGDLTIPLIDEDPFAYRALIEQKIDTHTKSSYLNYKFVISPEGDYRCEALKSNFILEENSWVDIEKDGEKFIPSAILNGKLTMNNELVKDIALNFQDLTIIAKKPYITDGIFGVNRSLSSPKLAGFQIVLDEIHGGILNGSPMLSFNGGLNFMGNQDGGNDMTLSVNAEFSVQTKVDTAPEPIDTSGYEALWQEKPRITHKGIYINDINIDFHHGEFDLQGRIKFFKDNPKYGNGFLGSIGLTMPKLGTIEAAAWFGNIPNEYRYWNVAVGVPLPPGVGFPPFFINNIYGALYHHMKPEGLDSASIANLLPGKVDVMKMDYMPNRDFKLGFKAGIGFDIASKNTANGNALFELGFTNSHGFDFLRINGDVRVMPNKSGSKNENSIDGYLAMVYSKPLETIHAIADVYIQFPGIQGVGEYGRAGRLMFHRDPNDWYLYVGRPLEGHYNGVRFFNTVEAKSYFQVGTKIDDIPALPTELISVFDQPTPKNTRNYEALNTGSGYSFGTQLKLGLDKQWGHVKLAIGVGVGLDLMVRNYPDGFSCNGFGNYTGMNNWYAMGQIYAYLNGSLSYRNWQILSLQAGAMLRGGFSNPTWAKGKVGARYRLLGGLYKGKVKADFVVGEACTPSGVSENDENSFVRNMWPVVGDDGYKCQRVPKVWSTFPLNSSFSREINGEYKTYIVKVDKIKHNAEDGTQYETTPVFYETDKIKIPHRNYNRDQTINVELSFKLYELNPEIGQYIESIDQDGIPIEEKVQFNFKTKKSYRINLVCCQCDGEGLNKWDNE